MRGELLGVWGESWRAIWEPLADDAPPDLFCELYLELAKALVSRPDDSERDRIANDPQQAKEAFRSVRPEDVRGEGVLAGFFEAVHAGVGGFDQGADDPLANQYFGLLQDFLETYSLGYELRRPCSLWPTLPAVFADLCRDLQRVCATDPEHLAGLLGHFDVAFRDLYKDRDDIDYRVTAFISRYTNLLEGLGRRHLKIPADKTITLGGICEKVETWPDERVKEAMKQLWTFANDYPGIRHGGSPGSGERKLEMRDFVALTIVLTGFIPYLIDEVAFDSRYRGG